MNDTVKEPEETSASPSPENDAASAPATDVEQGSSPTPDVEAESSTEAEVEDKATLLDAVQEVLTDKEAGEASSDMFEDEPAVEDEPAPETEAKSDQTEKPEDVPDEADDDQPLPDEVTEDELQNYTPKANKRIQQLVQQRRDLEAQVAEIQPFRQFVEQNNLEGDQLALGLRAMAALRHGEFQNFMDLVGPYVRQAQEYLGQALPADIQRDVDEGHMTTEAASRLTRERMDREMADVRARTEAERRAQTEQANLANSIQTAVGAWEDTVARNDPDYSKVVEGARAFTAMLRREKGEPQTGEQAVALAQEAYSRAKAQLKAAIPPPQATQQRPRAETPSGARMSAEPKTLMDAAINAIRS